MSQLLTFGELCEALSIASDLGITLKEAVTLYLQAFALEVL